MFKGFPVIDGDSHKVENWVILKEYLPSQYRDRIRPELCKYGYSRVVFYDYNPATGLNDLRVPLAKPDGMSKGLFSAFHPEGTLGALFNRLRIEHMDREGIDIGLVYPTVSLGINCLNDKAFSIALAKAYNDYILDDCAPYKDRLLPVAVIPLADTTEAVIEMQRCWDKGFFSLSVAPCVPVPHPDAPQAFPNVAVPLSISDKRFHPIFQKASELGSSLGIHGAGPGMYMPGGVHDSTDNFMINHIFAHRNQMQLALTRCIFDGVFDKFPDVNIAFLEGGCGWLPDLAHAFHEHWEKRLRDFQPDLQMDLFDYLGELRREVGTKRMMELSQSNRDAWGSQMVFRTRTEKQARRDEGDSYTWESELRSDPMEFLKRGQVVLGFEADDPAAGYMQAALGDWATDIPMWSVDYGHWDGDIKDCVKLLAEREDIPEDVRRKALGENAARHYGPRLQAVVDRHLSGKAPEPVKAKLTTFETPIHEGHRPSP